MQKYELHEKILDKGIFLSSIGEIKAVKKWKSDIHYLNVSASFDIEVTSFYKNKLTGETRQNVLGMDKKIIKKEWEKQATMYAWIFTFNGFATVGRTWEEYDCLIHAIKEKYGINDKLILPIYVHNLSYEFSFIKDRYLWEDVFALAEREPVRAKTIDGLEYRCSAKLSGYSLAKTGENLTKYKIEKMSGDLDYLQLRHSNTPLDEKEWKYILNDGLVVSAYVQEQIERYQSVLHIPMTKTGVVRRYLYEQCYGSKLKGYDKKRKSCIYANMISKLTLEEEEYKLARRAFVGGIVHCSAINEGRIYEDVTSYDFTSSYPYCLIAFKYPMGKGFRYRPSSIADFERKLEVYLGIFDIEFYDFESTQFFEHVLSSSKCWIIEDPVIDNGRVVKASKIRTSLTSIDYKMLKKFYKWSKMTLGRIYLYRQAYLPTDFVKAVISLYKEKTTLKDVDDDLSIARYQWSKEQLNSIYGCLVMSIDRPTFTYKEGAWTTEECNLEEAIEKYNGDKRRFGFYPWGCFVTAYARYNLSTGISEAGSTFDYIYSDTDSVKIKNAEKHEAYFEKYNRIVSKRLKMACLHHNIPFEDVSPKTKDGVTKMIGVWDKEYTAKRFKALRAKCYCYETDKKGFTITIAGVNKKIAVPALKKLSAKEGKDIFDYIQFGALFDEETCGKNLHSYIDIPMDGVLIDKDGVACEYSENSGVHLEATTYKLEASDEYLGFLSDIRESAIID